MSEICTVLTPEPICPACGHRHRDSFEWNFGSDMDGETTHECDSCGAEFECERVVSVDFTTRLLATPTTDGKTLEE